MDDWFTVDKIDDTTWVISEYGHWEQVHSYLLIGKSQAALIDTGMGVKSIKQIVDKLTELPVQVVLTHAHWDHIGDANEFEKVSIHQADSDWLEHGLPISDEIIHKNFAKEPTTKALPADFNLATYSTPKVKPTSILKDGENVDLGDRQLQIIYTPGHSPGGICILDTSKDYLFTGDMIYKGTLFMNYESTDPVAFADSIKKLSRLKGVKLVLPSHNETPLDPSVIRETEIAFDELRRKDQLKHGSGLHSFGEIKVLI